MLSPPDRLMELLGDLEKFLHDENIKLPALVKAALAHHQLVRDTGDWEEWLSFFLKGIIETANQAIETVQSILKLFPQDREKITSTGKPSASMLIIHNCLQKHPTTSSKKIVDHCSLTLPTAIKSINHLIALGIVTEVTGKARNKVYVYKN
jgi:Fic family protein